ALVRVAPEIGIVKIRIGVDRYGQHIVTFVEDALCAVAMMYVDIEDRHALMLRTQTLRGDCRIVQKAETAGHVGIGMMARRPAKSIDLPLAGQYSVGGR